MDYSREQRFQEFLRRLGRATAANDFEEAYVMLCTTLNQVENELTDIPFAPLQFQTDGRMYPPEPDNMCPVAAYDGVFRFRSRGHNTFIASNGALEIQTVMGGHRVFQKLGADGRDVWSSNVGGPVP